MKINEVVYPLIKPIKHNVLNGEYEWEIPWSGTFEEHIITIKSLMETFGWSKEKAQEFINELIEDWNNEE